MPLVFNYSGRLWHIKVPMSGDEISWLCRSGTRPESSQTWSVIFIFNDGYSLLTTILYGIIMKNGTSFFSLYESCNWILAIKHVKQDPKSEHHVFYHQLKLLLHSMYIELYGTPLIFQISMSNKQYTFETFIYFTINKWTKNSNALIRRACRYKEQITKSLWYNIQLKVK